MRQQLILKEQQLQLTVSEILRTNGKQFRQITERYSDGFNGRCVLGVIMSYYGWNGHNDSQSASKLLGSNRIEVYTSETILSRTIGLMNTKSS
jgi:hypothetical protein